MATFQCKFKLNSQAAPGSRLSRPFTPRKAHTKSRNGCRACKERRIKCDEKRPTCSKCATLDAQCIYDDKQRSHTQSSTYIGVEANTMSLGLVAQDLARLLNQEPGPMQDANIRVLQHFQTVVSSTLGCSQVQSIMQTSVGRSACSNPFLMHMVLAISLAHTRHLPNATLIGKPSHLLEVAHWDNALRSYRRHLAELDSGSVTIDMDAVIATTILSILYTFALEETIDINALSSNSEDFQHMLEPLAAVGSFAYLSCFYNALDSSSAWTTVLFSTDNTFGSYTDSRPGINGLPRALVRLCGLSSESSSETDPYHRIVRSLTPLLLLEPSSKNFAVLLAFLGRTWSRFKPLVTAKDPRALLLLAYWLLLLREIDQWWLTTRAKTTYAAIATYLTSLDDPSINAMLPPHALSEHVDNLEQWRWFQSLASDRIRPCDN